MSTKIITLTDVKLSSFSNYFVDYLCVDTQGHEKPIICNTDPDFLKSNFGVIDVELMTDIGQYSVHPDNWKHVVQHLLLSGFEPLIHPHGLTESYLFINSTLKPQSFSPIINLIRDKHMKSFFSDSTGCPFPYDTACFASLGDHSFLPLTHVGGSIHASKLQNFREDFISFYLLNLGLFTH